jgi:transposase-like protein
MAKPFSQDLRERMVRAVQAGWRGARRRRFWSSDEKRRMVAESLAKGASVSKVAQRYGVNANLLFTWRRQEAAQLGYLLEGIDWSDARAARAEADLMHAHATASSALAYFRALLADDEDVIPARMPPRSLVGEAETRKA